MSVCVFVCVFISLSHFLIPFNGLFAPISRSPMSRLFRYSESLGKRLFFFSTIFAVLEGFFGIGATIRIGWEMFCLPYAEFFRLTLSLLNVSKQVILNTNKWDWGPQGPPNFCHQIWEIPLSKLRSERRPLSWNMFTSRPIKKYSLNSWSCLQHYCGASSRQKSPLDDATDFLSTISFVSAFIFVLPRKPENASKRVWSRPEHNLVHFKSLWGCLLIKN